MGRRVAAGLLSAERAAAIVEWEAALEAPRVPARPRRAVAEALGCLGGLSP